MKLSDFFHFFNQVIKILILEDYLDMNGNSDPGNDIFSTRPSTAQVRAQRQKAYKEALEAQLHSRKRSLVRK